MNKYVKAFLHRGLIFGGFGPIVTSIVFLILSFTIENFSLGAKEVFIAIVSTYTLAFLHAGASIFNQIEEWPLAKSLLCNFSVLFFAYATCYLINSWIPFEPIVILIFCIVFTLTYFIIWFTVYFILKSTSNSFNKKLKR